MGRSSTNNIYRYMNYIAAGAILLMVLAAYIPAMRSGYIWDDNNYVTQNPLLTMPDGLKRIWFSLDSPSQYFPLVYTSFRVEHAIWGLNPIGYHVINILLHAANAILLWWILRRLKVPGAWLAAAIWALHPVNVESVAWITERKNTLSTLFYMLSVLGWMHSVEESGERKWMYYGLSLGATMLALFAKTTACTIPAALLVVLWLKHERIDLKRLAQIVPFGVIGVAMGLVSIWWEKNHQGTLGATFAFTLPERFIIAGHALWFYLGKVFLPVKLTFSYPQWKLDAAAPLQYLWLLAAISGIVALWIYRKKIGSGPLVGTAFFAATLAPLLGFISLYTFRYTFVADHYQYVACIGPIVLLSAFIYKRWESPAVRAGISAVILLALGAMTWVQGGVYKSAETVWSDTLAKNPASWMAHDGLGAELDHNGQAAEAMKHYQKSLELNPDHWEVYANIGAFLVNQDRPRDAITFYAKSLEINPQSARVHAGMANALGHAGRNDDAINEYTAALKLDPDSAGTRCNMAIVLVDEGKYKEALAQLRTALKIDPYLSEAHHNLKVIEDKQASAQSGAAVPKRDPAVTHYLAAVEFHKQGKLEEAVKEYSEAVRLRPDFAEAHSNLGLAYQGLSRFDESAAECKTAVKLKPDMGEAHNNLAIAYLMKGQPADAWKEVGLSRKYGVEPDPGFIAALKQRMPEPK